MANFPTHQVFIKFSFLKKFSLEPLPCSIWTDCPLGLACTVSLCCSSPSSGAPLLLSRTGLPLPTSLSWVTPLSWWSISLFGSLRYGTWMVNFQRTYLSENVSHLVDNLAGDRNLCWRWFSFRFLKAVFHYNILWGFFSSFARSFSS